MKTTGIHKKQVTPEKNISVNFELQQLYTVRMERFMALVELSYALKHAPKIVRKK